MHTDAKTYLSERAFNVNFEHKGSTSFLNNWDDNRKLRDCAGVILRRVIKGKGEVLFVYSRDKYNKILINFPMGKIDYDDKKNLQTTALRELGEEVNYIWPENVKINNYIDLPYYVRLSDGTYAKKIHRFYLCFNFKDNIDPMFQRKNEVDGNVWIRTDKLKQYFSQSEYKYYNSSKRIKFIEKSFLLTSSSLQNYDSSTDQTEVNFASSVQNFFLRDSRERNRIFTKRTQSFFH